MCLALWASGLWLRYAALQNLIPSFPWIAPLRPPPWSNPRKGRDQILPSGNLVIRQQMIVMQKRSVKTKPSPLKLEDPGYDCRSTHHRRGSLQQALLVSCPQRNARNEPDLFRPNQVTGGTESMNFGKKSMTARGILDKIITNGRSTTNGSKSTHGI